MKALILHHFEPYWNDSLEKFYTSFQDLQNKVLDYISHNDFSTVIVTSFEENQLSPEHNPLIKLCRSKNIKLEHYNYGYGWYRELDINENTDCETFPIASLDDSWCYGQRDYHTESDVLLIEDWQKSLKNLYSHIELAGAFEDECICDMETVLSITNTHYERIPELIVGSYIEYEYKGLSPVKLFETLSNELNEISHFVENKFLEYNINTLQQLFNKEPLTVKNIEENINNVVFNNVDKIINYELYLYSDCEEVSNIMLDILNNECASDRYISKYNLLESDKILDFIDNITMPEKNIQKRKVYK